MHPVRSVHFLVVAVLPTREIRPGVVVLVEKFLRSGALRQRTCHWMFGEVGHRGPRPRPRNGRRVVDRVVP